MSLGSEFAVCAVVGSCVGVAEGEQDEEVLVSLESGAIQVFNVCDCRMVCSWQLPSSERLQCAAVVQRSGGHYWTVGATQGLLQWLRTDSFMRPAPYSVPSQSIPLQLLTCTDGVLLVFTNGDVGVVSSKMGVVSKVPTVSLVLKRAKGWMLSTAAVSCDRTVCVVGTTKDVTIGIAELAAGELRPPLVTSIPSRGADLLSSGVCGCQLLLLFSAGEVMMVHLESPLQPFHRVLTLPVPPSLGSTHLLALSAEYFALFCGQSLQLWEGSHYTCQQVVETRSCPKPKVWCAGSCVYMWCEDSLYGWRLDASPATLAAAMGKRLTSTAQTVTLSSWPLTNEEIRDSAVEVSESDAGYLRKLVSRTETPDHDTFASVFSSRDLDPDLCYSDVIERLLSEEGFWCSDVIYSLLQAGLVPGSADVLSEGVRREDWGVVECCLTHGPTPSENAIVTALQRVLRLPESVEGKRSLLRENLLYLWVWGVVLYYIFPCCTLTLNVFSSKLLCCPFTDVVMQSCLAVVPFSVIKEILQHLLGYVGVASLLSQPSGSALPYDVVLEWVALILDSHFMQFTLDQQSQQLLLTVQSRVYAQVTCYSRLSTMFSLAAMEERISC